VTIPDYQTAMFPLLQAAADGRAHRLTDFTEALADHFHLTTEEVTARPASGGALVFSNRLQWAKTYLTQAGLLEPVSRGVFRITEAGQQVLAEPPAKIDVKFLDRYPTFRDFMERSGRAGKASGTAPVNTPIASNETPQDTMERAWTLLRGQVATELLDTVRRCTPAFFEQLVVDLLVAMGYGGSRADAGQSIGKTGDDGLDGIIKEDKLGLDAVYIQAKRWKESVGRPVVQAFAGSLEGVRARKGVFITTSTFTSDARAYVDRIEKRIVLIDGEMLAELMVEHAIGVDIARTYTVPRIDLDYFEQE
jgi:restriction system protein